MTDEKAESSTAKTEETEEKDESLETSEADTETSEGEESQKAVPYNRFKQVNEAKKQAETIASWYRENIGDPNDVVAFKAWKAEQVKKAEKAEEEGEISPQKLAEIRKLMRKADPEYAQWLEKNKQEEADRIESRFDTAEDEIRELAATEFGLKTKADEADISWLGQQTMLAIRNDPKLLRMWETGNLACVKKGFKIVQERQEKLGKSVSKLKQQAIDKRKVSKLPTLPSAQGTLSGNNQGQKEKGITKQTHDDAWAVFQQGMQE